MDTLENQEVKKELKIGPFKPKEKFIEFIGTKGNIKFISDEALIEGKYLSGLDMDDIIFKLTICDEDTVNLEEVNTNRISKSQRERLLDVICEKSIASFHKKMVIVDLPFKSTKKINDKSIDLYLSVDYKTPISKLASVFEEPEITEEQYSKVNDILSSIFDDSEMDEHLNIGDDESNPKNIDDNIESIGNSDQTDTQRELELSFNKMKEDKIVELKNRISHQLKEIQQFEYEKAQAEKKLETSKNEVRLLESRLESLKPLNDPNGYYFNVSELLNEKVVLEETISNIIKEKISKIKSINAEAFMKIFEQGEYNIKIGQLLDGLVIETTNYKEIPEDVKTSLSEIGVLEGKDGLVYIGELDWHDLVGKFLKKGFLQDPEFDKLCGSNSYLTGTNKDIK